MINAAAAGLFAAGVAGASYVYEHTHEFHNYLPTGETEQTEQVDTASLEYPAK